MKRRNILKDLEDASRIATSRFVRRVLIDAKDFISKKDKKKKEYRGTAVSLINFKDLKTGTDLRIGEVVEFRRTGKIITVRGISGDSKGFHKSYFDVLAERPSFFSLLGENYK